MGNDFFEDIGRKISETAKGVGKKTNEVVEQQRLKSQIYNLEKEVECLYQNMGTVIWERYKEGRVAESEFIVSCEEVAEKKELIEQYKLEIGMLKRNKICPNCGVLLGKEDIFCKSCGANTKEIL